VMLVKDEKGEIEVKLTVPTQNSECRSNSRISLAFGVLSRDNGRLPPQCSASLGAHDIAEIDAEVLAALTEVDGG